MSEMKNISINGTLLTCKHCGGGTFAHQHALMNTSGMTFLGLEWLNSEADVYVCGDCGFLHWFLTESIGPKPNDMVTETTCLECEAEIPAGEDVCAQCGWTYRNTKK